MQKKFILVILLVMSLIGGIGGLQANDTITSVLPVLKKDQRGYKLTPIVVFNKTTNNYETVYLKVDASGNLFTTFGGTVAATIVGTVDVTGSTVSIAGIVPVSQSGVWKATETINTATFGPVAVSSSVATLIFAENANRTTLEINLQTSSYDISISTFAIVSPNQGFYLSAGTIWTPEKRITAPLYGIAINGAADVRTVEYEEQ